MTPASKRAQLRSLAAAGTPGPWYFGNVAGQYFIPRWQVTAASRPILEDPDLIAGQIMNPADAWFIASCDPTTITQLLDTIDGLAEALRYYANRSTWKYQFDGYCTTVPADDTDFDPHEMMDGVRQAGKRARAALEKLEKE